LWRYRASGLTFLALGKGDYHPIERSIAFPFVAAGELDSFIANADSIPYPQWQDEFRRWVRSKE
jgi:hypothetical protein